MANTQEMPLLAIVQIVRFYIRGADDGRSCAVSVAGVLRCVNRQWKEACDGDAIWLKLCSMIWPRTTLIWTGCNVSELDKLQNEHFMRHFVGFGHGRRYLASAEGRAATANIDAMSENVSSAKVKLQKAADEDAEDVRKWLPKFPKVGAVSHSGQPEAVSSWQECFLQMWTIPTKCFQCEATFVEANNTAESCRHHPRGGGTIFDGDDFIGVDFTCCNKNKPTPGCRVTHHNREDGLHAPHNAGKSWSTAHM